MNTKAIAKASCFHDWHQYFFSCFSLEFICLTGEGLRLMTLCLHEYLFVFLNKMLPLCNEF